MTLNQTPEQIARDNIDRQLEQAGWVVQNKDRIDWQAGPGIAVRHYLTQDGKEADYVLFLGQGRPVGIIEAKKEDEGHHLTVVEEQSGEYAHSKLKYLNNDPLPFVYESTGVLTRFTDYRDPKPRSRPVFTFHRPETFAARLQQPASLRERLQALPTLPLEGLRDCQITAITNLEHSFQQNRPRALIKAMVECVRPAPGKTIADPACGTGGFFLAAYDFLVNRYQLDREQKELLKLHTFRGNEIVASTRRLCLMNMFLHNIGQIDGQSMVAPTDALIADSGERFDYALANPPFGKKSSITATNDAGEQEREEFTYNRQDFWATTSNKQLNFVQHIRTMLKTSGQAAVVVPDNVLFEGGAGETVRKRLLQNTDLHTILRLPTGVFYKQGVKANVIFFDNKPASKEPWTQAVWIYDFRTNIHFTLKKNPLKFEDLQEFITCYNAENRHQRRETWSEANPDGRWRQFSYADIIARDKTNLDIFWLKDQSLADLDNLPDPDILAEEIIENIESALEGFKDLMATLNGGE